MAKKKKEVEKEHRLCKKYKLTESELERVVKSNMNEAPQKSRVFKDYFTDRVKIGVFSDAHIGHEMFDEAFFRHMVKTFKKEKVDRVFQSGDILEGMSGRPGHIYELSQIGYHNQMKKAVSMFRLLKDFKVAGIDGNHDGWYQKKGDAGVIVGNELEKRLDNYTHLGQMEADVKIAPNITMKLYHGGDGTAYAISYKMQKLMESFTGGEKPAVVLSGHYHKALYMFNRNIHGLECGTLCGQTGWMRGKKIPAHKGFWILDMKVGKGGIGMFKPAFYPGYK